MNLSRPGRGELLAVLGGVLLALGLLLPWYEVLALLGCLLAVVGSALRASGSERPRKPPGVL